jgi:hypothetical protein
LEQSSVTVSKLALKYNIGNHNRDYAMQKYIAETRMANKSDVSPNTPRADEANW